MPEFGVSLLTILLTAAVAVPIAILSMFLAGLLRLEAARPTKFSRDQHERLIDRVRRDRGPRTAREPCNPADPRRRELGASFASP